MAKDMLGVEIREGDIIATAQRRSSSTWIATYKVKSVGEVEFEFYDSRAKNPRTYTRRGDSVVVCQRST